MDPQVPQDNVYTIRNFLEYYKHNSKEKISFKISLNLAFFLADNIEVFLEYFKFMKKSYSVRSGLTHGSDWRNRLIPIINYYPSLNDHLDLIYRWKFLLNSCLKRIISLKQEDSEILEDINQLEGIDNRENLVRKGEYLLELGENYRKISQDGEAMKMYLKSMITFSESNDSNKLSEVEKKIREIYNERDIFFNPREWDEVMNELDIIIKYDSQRKKEANELKKRIEEFYLGIDYEEIEFNRKINGEDIGEIFNIDPPSPKIGKIINYIQDNIDWKDLTKKELLELLKNKKKEILNEISESED